MSMTECVKRLQGCKTPIVAIPVPGKHPFAIRRELLVQSLKGLQIIDAGIQLALDGRLENSRLVVYATGEHVQAIRKFAPLERNQYLKVIWDWTEGQRKSRAKPKVKLSASDKYIAKLRKQLEKLNINPPLHPYRQNSRSAEYVRRMDGRALASWERWEAEDATNGSSHMSKPLTCGEQWAEWKRQAKIRRWIQLQARLCRAGKFNTTLYRNLSERGIQVKKWNELSVHDRRQCGETLDGYLDTLWKFCGLMTGKPYQFEPEDEPKIGPEWYADWLEVVREHKAIASEIASIEMIQNEK